MITGQRVRVRTSSHVARDWKIPSDSQGVVVCSYRLFTRGRIGQERLDVRFTPNTMIWGRPADGFELVDDDK